MSNRLSETLGHCTSAKTSRTQHSPPATCTRRKSLKVSGSAALNTTSTIYVWWAPMLNLSGVTWIL